jgi:chromosome partitioning protein
MAEERTNLGSAVAQEVRQAFPGKVFHTHIPRNIRLAEEQQDAATAAGGKLHA